MDPEFNLKETLNHFLFKMARPTSFNYNLKLQQGKDYCEHFKETEGQTGSSAKPEQKQL